MREHGARSTRTLLVVAHVFPPDNISGAARPGRFLKYLPCFGYHGVVVASAHGKSPGSPAVRRVPDSRTRVRAARLATRAAAFVQRWALPYNDELPWTPHAIAAGLQEIAASPGVSAILSTSPPIATHYAALWLKRKTGLPWIADFRDPLAENPFRSRAWPFPYDRLVERVFFENADAIIANTDRVGALWAERYPQWGRKLHVIWNGFDPEDPVGPAAVPERSRRVLLHAGTIYGNRHPAALLESIDRLVRTGALAPGALRVQLVGPMISPHFSAQSSAAAALAESGCLEYVDRMIPQPDARRLMAEADYLLLLDQNDRNADLQLPAKIFDYVRIGRPVLCFTQPGSPSTAVLRLAGTPHVVIPAGASAAQVDESVLRFLRLPASATPPGPEFLRQFDAVSQTRELAAIIDSLSRR